MQINYPNDNKFSNFFKKLNRKWLYIGVFFFIVLVGFIYFYYNSGSASPSTAKGMSALSATNAADPGTTTDIAAANSQLLSEINNELTQTTQAVTAAAQTQPAAGSIVYTFLKVILGLAVIIVLIYLTVFLLRFFNKNKINSAVKLKAGKNLIKVLDSANISANKSIQLVSVAGKMIIIGVTDSTISLLSEVAPGKTKDVDEFLQDTQSEEPSKTSFKSVLSNYFKK